MELFSKIPLLLSERFINSGQIRGVKSFRYECDDLALRRNNPNLQRGMRTQIHLGVRFFRILMGKHRITSHYTFPKCDCIIHIAYRYYHLSELFFEHVIRNTIQLTATGTYPDQRAPAHIFIPTSPVLFIVPVAVSFVLVLLARLFSFSRTQNNRKNKKRI